MSRKEKQGQNELINTCNCENCTYPFNKIFKCSETVAKTDLHPSWYIHQYPFLSKSSTWNDIKRFKPLPYKLHKFTCEKSELTN